LSTVREQLLAAVLVARMRENAAHAFDHVIEILLGASNTLVLGSSGRANSFAGWFAQLSGGAGA